MALYRSAAAISAVELLKAMRPRRLEASSIGQHRLLCTAITAGHLAGYELLHRRLSFESLLASIASEGTLAMLEHYFAVVPMDLNATLWNIFDGPAVSIIERGDVAMLELLLKAVRDSGRAGRRLYACLLPSMVDESQIDILPIVLNEAWFQLSSDELMQLPTWICTGAIARRRGSVLWICDYVQERSSLDSITRARLQYAVTAYRMDASADLPLIALLMEVIGPMYDGPLLSVSAQYGRLDVLRLLISRGAPVQFDSNEPLRRAVKQGHVATAAYLLSKGAYRQSLSSFDRLKLDEFVKNDA